MPIKVPNHPVNASFWSRLQPSTREHLASMGIGPRELGSEPSSAEVAAPARSTSARAQQLRDDADAGNRSERRRQAALEREASRRRELEQRIARRAQSARELKRAAERALRSMTPHQRRLAKLALHAERDTKHLQRVRDRLAANFPEEEVPDIAAIPRSVWIMVRDCMADPTGRAIRIWFSRLRNKVAVGLIRIAALVPVEGGTRYTWADSRARAIAALGLALHELSTPTVRKGAWARVVRGIPRGALCALLANPWEPTRRPHPNTLGGVHVFGATLETGQVGYLRALELAGFLYRQQLPAAAVAPWERWRVRRGDRLEQHASNRYWIVTDAPTAPVDDDHKRELIAAHHAGLEAHEERPTRAPRTAYERELVALELAQPAREAPS